MQKNPEDLLLLQRAYDVCGGYDGFGKNFPWEASYVQRVKSGEKPMADALRWALKKIIADKENTAPKEVARVGTWDTSLVKVKLAPEVLSELQSLAGDEPEALSAIIQSAVIFYISEFKSKDHLTLFKPSFLKTRHHGSGQHQSSRQHEPASEEIKK